MAQDELYLLDTNSLTYRAFYALPESLTKSDGTVTNAVFGFTKMLLSLINDREPDLLGAAFDAPGDTFRHEEFEDYKANREETPDDLKPQFGMVKEVLEALKVPTFEVDRYEADDLIGTLAKKAEQEGYQVTIVTGDRDQLQLISENIRVMYTKRGISDIVDYDLETFREEYELEPEQIIDKKALMGDKSDNIPGVDGIGDKTSTKLLKEFDTLERLLDNIEEVGGKKRKQKLREQGDRAREAKSLITIDVEAPIEIDFDELVLSDLDTDEAYQLFVEMEFNSLISQIGGHRSLEEVDYQVLSKREEVEKLSLPDKIAVALGLSGARLEETLEQMVVSLPGGKTYCFNLAEEDLLSVLPTVLNDKELLMYQPKRQFRYLLRQGIKAEGLEFAPLLVDYLLRPSQSEKNFTKLVENHLQQTLPDVEGEELLALQTQTLFQLEDKLTEKLAANDLTELYQDLELPLVKLLARMELNGIKASYEQLEELSAELEGKIKEIEKEVHELAGEEFNLNSPQQLGNILFEKLGLPVIKKTETGNYSTSADVLEELEGKHPIISLILDYRTYTKLKSTYVDPLEGYIREETGRIHTNFNQKVTSTGRLSSTEPNLQNIPIRTEEGRKIRQVFVAEEGYKLLSADYSQVELRVLAHISEDEGLKSAFRDGVDIHTKTAKEIFGLATDQTRRKAKAVNFGIAYGISAWGLADRLDINQQEAQEYIDLYFERYPQVKEYIDNRKEQAKEQGYVTTIFNRRRYLPEINSSNYHRRQFAERTAINTPIQGSAADIMKLAMIEVAKELDEHETESKILLQVHDELVVEVPGEELDTISGLVQETMEQVIDLKVPLDVDLKVGNNWNQMEIINND